jgi:hypothetical protein
VKRGVGRGRELAVRHDERDVTRDVAGEQGRLLRTDVAVLVMLQSKDFAVEGRSLAARGHGRQEQSPV